MLMPRVVMRVLKKVLGWPCHGNWKTVLSTIVTVPLNLANEGGFERVELTHENGEVGT